MGISQRSGRYHHVPGQAASRAWLLPADASCARRARALVDELCTEAGVPRETAREAKVMVSELATNAFQHAASADPHELWFDAEADEVVVGVFDALPLDGVLGDVTFSGDHGRGLLIVAELSGGRCGLEPAPSRLHPAINGKIVWFAVPRY